MILTTSSLKGGVGKTSLTIFLAQALARQGHRVLVVDLDHNNNLTDYMLRDADAEGIEHSNIRHVLTGARKVDDGMTVWHTPLGDIIPATPSLATVGIECASNPAAVLRLRSGLRKLDYDYILIDTPPALTIELTAGLYAADLVLVPLSASRWTVQGYDVIAEEVARVEDAGIQAPRMLAVASMVTPTQEAALREIGAWTMASQAIYRDATIQAATTEGRALRDGTRASGWFDELAREVVG